MTWNPHVFTAAGRNARVCRFPDRRWLSSCTIYSPAGETIERAPADEESLLVILGGTHDLAAGGGGWAGRGVRPSPMAGRPCALFLPPRTPFHAQGSGELLVVSLRLPAAAPAPAAATKPLLPLAGSGKAYDSGTGQWQRLEDMPSAPEAILPRRIATETIDGVRFERVFAADYKARVSSLDETVLQEGQRLVLAPPAHAQEIAIYFRTEGALRAGSQELRGEGVLTGPAGPHPLAAAAGPAYLAITYAGPK